MRAESPLSKSTGMLRHVSEAASIPAKSRAKRKLGGLVARSAMAVFIVVIIVFSPIPEAHGLPVNSVGVRYSGACVLLPDILPVIASGNNSDPLGLNGMSPQPGGPSGPNITVGAIRAIWSGICQSPDFIGVSQNLSESSFGYQAFWNGVVDNLTFEPGFDWTGSCTGSTSTFGSGFQPISPSSTPAYSGSGCDYQEYWSGNITKTGTTVFAGRFLSEAVESNLPHGGALQRGGSYDGGRLPWLVQDILLLGVILGLLVGVTTYGRGISRRGIQLAARDELLGGSNPSHSQPAGELASPDLAAMGGASGTDTLDDLL